MEREPGEDLHGRVIPEHFLQPGRRRHLRVMTHIDANDVIMLN